jgi:hypothetical protein
MADNARGEAVFEKAMVSVNIRMQTKLRPEHTLNVGHPPC